MSTNAPNGIPETIKNAGIATAGVGVASIVAGTAFNLHGLLSFGADLTGIGAITALVGYGLRKLLQRGKSTVSTT